MRIIPFLYNVIDKFAPMDEVEKANLRQEAMSWYTTQLNKMSAGEKVPAGQFLKKAESWQWRTAIAILFIWIVPQIQQYIVGERDEEQEEDQGGFF